ncbi:MAG: hypothetical protein Q9195_007322, partial [Heterodermia aff. obscurata]
MTTNLFNPSHQACVPSLAARRLARYEKQKQNGNRLAPSEAVPNSINQPHSPTPDFTFTAPRGTLVHFAHPILLPRSTDFAPPAYSSPDPTPPIPPASPRPTAITVTVRELSATSPSTATTPSSPNPTPSSPTPSLPPYHTLSPGPPTGPNLTHYIIPGTETDPQPHSPTRYLPAPFISNPDLPYCTSPSCPLYPTPHHLGLYYSNGLRPGASFQLHLGELGGIFEGGNPPSAVWRALLREFEGEEEGEGRVLERWMRFHCQENGGWGYYREVIREAREEEGEEE